VAPRITSIRPCLRKTAGRGSYFQGGEHTMLDINLIRSNPDFVVEALKKREYDVLTFAKVISLLFLVFKLKKRK
jgi:hypothetical protein